MSVSPSTLPNAPGSVAARPILFVAAAWRALTWRHVLYMFLFCSLWSVIEVAAATSNFSEGFAWSPSLNSWLSMQLNGFAVMLAVLVADRASPPPMRRWWLYVVAVLVGVAVATTLFWVVSQRVFFIPSAPQLRGIPEGFDSIVFRHGTNRLFICGLAVFVYVSRRFAAQRLAALRAMQLERAESERRLLESRLAAMQGRVEPEFLLDTLAQVERLYDIDAQAADRVLKELTAYLRAAIPTVGDAASTVAKEVRLTNAFVNIAGLRSRDILVPRGNGAAFMEGARMPPMVLLPLIKHALAHRAERAQGDEQFEINAEVRDHKLLLTIRDRGSCFVSSAAGDAEIVRIQERLATLYGEQARLKLNETEGGSEAVLEIPSESRAGNIEA